MYIVGITSLFLYFIFVFFKYVRVTLTQGYHETTLCIPALFYKRQIDPKGNCEELTEWPISNIEERVAIHIWNLGYSRQTHTNHKAPETLH